MEKEDKTDAVWDIFIKTKENDRDGKTKADEGNAKTYETDVARGVSIATKKNVESKARGGKVKQDTSKAEATNNDARVAVGTKVLASATAASSFGDSSC